MKVRGWIYVLTNKGLPGLLKIGFTLKDPSLRARDLGGTGHPHPFVVAFELLAFSPREIEFRVHERLVAYHEEKEFFKCDLAFAIKVIREEAAKLKAVLLDSYPPEYSADSISEVVSEVVDKTSVELMSSITCPTCKNESAIVEYRNASSGPRCMNCGQRLIPLDLRIRNRSV